MTRSLYREYLMTHHSLREKQYPNGPHIDDRKIKPNNELKNVSSHVKKKNETQK